MSSAEEGQKAIEALHGQNHDGRDLTVNEAKPMESRGPAVNPLVAVAPAVVVVVTATK